jgi:hypothetical protein
MGFETRKMPGLGSVAVQNVAHHIFAPRATDSSSRGTSAGINQ